ncbi:hypothetical protein WN944_006622 [Citrus x changshan-huyou]|uniref:Uncharacterized protein n=1 Tax=Citrus x changshan-huyou TaxID=2935761 RepID=A0AAP0MM06_9ROSI
MLFDKELQLEFLNCSNNYAFRNFKIGYRSMKELSLQHSINLMIFHMGVSHFVSIISVVFSKSCLFV